MKLSALMTNLGPFDFNALSSAFISLFPLDLFIKVGNWDECQYNSLLITSSNKLLYTIYMIEYVFHDGEIYQIANCNGSLRRFIAIVLINI